MNNMAKLLLIPIGFMLLCIGCKPAADNASKRNSKDTAEVINYDTIPDIRKSVRPNAVAAFSEPVKDPLNDWKFLVSVYETEKTFSFLVRMQYKELRASQSFTIPNFGIQPKVEIRKAKEPFSCIIGFFDKKEVFREYIKVAVKGDQLKFTKINSYYAGAYRTKV